MKISQASSNSIGFFSRCVVLSLHSSSRNGMEQCRTSLLGLIWSHALKKQEDTESTLWAVISGTSGVCWTQMVVSLGGRKLKPRPSLMLLGHHVLHWWAMKKYKRGQMSAMTANLLSLVIWWKRHQFLQQLRHSLDFESWKKGLETLEALKGARSMQIQKTALVNSISTEFTAALCRTAKTNWLTGYGVMIMWS